MKKLFLLSLAALMVFAACQPAQQPTQQTQTQNTSGQRMQKPVGDFRYDQSIYEWVGTLYLEWSARVVQMDQAFCEENCQKFDYVFFEYTSEYDAQNRDFGKYMEQNEGNSFAGGGAVGIGCAEEHGIRRQSLRQKLPAIAEPIFAESTINQTDSEKILNSSAEKPVLLKLTRYGNFDGGAPDCYSHFSEIELITIADNV